MAGGGEKTEKATPKRREEARKKGQVARSQDLNGALAAGAQHAFAAIFVSAIEVAAPVLLAVIITDAGFGVVSRVMPQLNVFAVGFPAKILVGFLLVSASLPFAAGWIGDQLTKSVGTALHTLKVA